MELALRNSLNSIFERHDETRRAARDTATHDAKIAKRLEMFRHKRETMFRPVMDAVGSYLLTKGYDFEVLIVEADLLAAPRDREARFCFHVIDPPRRRDVRDYPGLSVICDPFSNTVRFRANRTWPGVATAFAPSTALTVEEIDLAAFQEQMLAFLAAVFR